MVAGEEDEVLVIVYLKYACSRYFKKKIDLSTRMTWL